MLNVKELKLRKERVDEFRVRHYFDAGTKHLPPLYAAKHYNYTIYDLDGKMLSFRDDYLRTLKDVKEWIAAYDDIEDARLADKAAEQAARDLEWAERRAAQKLATENMRATVIEPKRFIEGQMVKGVFPSLNKNNEIGEYVVITNLPEDNEGGYKNWKIENAKVVKVVELNVDQYDDLIVNLMNHQDYLITEGGSACDDPRVQDFENFQALYNDKEAYKIYTETAYGLVHAIQAPNRETFLVNTEGYTHARYIGFVR